MIIKKTKISIDELTISILEPLFGANRTIYIDNFYTSLNVARELMKNQTHVVGTLRKNKKAIPDKLKTNISKGDVLSMRSDDGITITKIHDQKEVSILSTKVYGNKFIIKKKKSGLISLLKRKYYL